MGPEASSQYLEAIKDTKSDTIRLTALQGLNSAGGQPRQALPFLITALKEGSVNSRSLAAILLGNIGPDAKEAIPALEALQNDSNTALRANVQRALKSIRGR
jgi:HEAT repeat protein